MRARMLAWLAGAIAVLAGAPAAAPAATAYVLTCSCADVVEVIDTATRSHAGTIGVGSMPQAIAVTRDGRTAFTANVGDGSISVIDGATRTTARTIALGDDLAPFALAVSPDGATLWVFVINTDIADEELLAVDVASGAIVDRATVPFFAPGFEQIAIAPAGDRLYAAVTLTGQLLRFDLTQPGFPSVDISPADPNFQPSGVTVAPNGTVYVSDAGNGASPRVWRLNPDGTTIDAIPLPDPGGGAPAGVALDPAGARAWVSGTPADEATEIDTATKATAATTGVGGMTMPVAVSPDGDAILLGALDDPLVYVVDPQTRARVAAIPVADTPTAIVVAPTPPRPAAVGGRPVVRSVSPAEGPATGGQEVRIEGANFATGVRVLFGDTPAATARVVDFNTLVATTPPGAAGPVRVQVVAPSGARSTEDVAYRYVEAPAPAPTPAPGPGAAPSLRRCVVPDVRGLRLPDARRRLRAAGCAVGFVSRLRGHRRQRVVRQALAPGTVRPHGWGVALALRPRR